MLGVVVFAHLQNILHRKIIHRPQTVVKPNVLKIVDAAHLDAFLANCDCKHESRNTVLLKVVVIFVICVVFVLVTYMLFLMCLNPMLRKQRNSVPYRQQNDEMEDNIFARTTPANDRFSDISPSITMRSRNSKFFANFNDYYDNDYMFQCLISMKSINNVLGRVEAEQNRWMRKVEEQRRNIFTDHTMLN
ncbi:unnamed protein product [Acanthocheilonema viteae]|uniref:Uncharacterized protein n=1 Tax=Acanthocheilonema viteae TaxID=6277 RepID=A0A498SGV1_ACAVI|nr:unnamed protein product [Acanthocheilonema viteae]